MKLNIPVIAAGCLVFLATGCNKQLDRLPLDSPSSASFYNDATEVELGVLGCYKSLTWELKSTRPWPVMMDNTTDVSWNRSSHPSQELGNGTATSTNESAQNAWTGFYKAIGRANFLLDNIENAKGNIDDKYYRQVIAEARFVRAFSYAMLTELFGGVPLVTKVLTVDEAQMAKTSKAEIVEWILNELDEAVPDLPPFNTGNITGRATQAAAYALKARVALYNEKWDIAADAANAARGTGKYGLYENYGDLFNYTGEYCKEHIFSLQYLKGTLTHTNSNFISSRLAGGVSNEVPTQQMLDSYECIDGLTIDKSPRFDPQHPFKDRDPRLAMSIAVPGSVYYGFQFETHPDSTYVWNYNVTPAIRIRNTDATNTYATFTGYLWRKWTDIKDMPDDQNCDGDIVLIRYAEVLLTYAEARIEANKIDESVYLALDSVRLRAGMPAVPRGSSQPYLRSLVRRERKVELANEGLRLSDIRRWRIAEKVMTGPRYGRIRTAWLSKAPTLDENTIPDYSEVPNAGEMRVIENMVFDPNRDYLWPIPNIEILTNKKLKQNEHW